MDWYDAYNKTKHDKTAYFSEATLKHCINAVVACLVMHCVRFGPFPMFEENNRFASLVTHHFNMKLTNPSPQTFYLHEIELPINTMTDLFVSNPRKNGNVLPFSTQKLVL